MLSRAFQGPDRVVSLGGRHIKMCKLERLPKWLLAVALFFGLSSGPAFASYTPVGDNVFSFDNTSNVTISGTPQVLVGFFTGSGGNITGFNGTFGGSAITGFTGLISGGYAGSYTGTPGAYAMGPNISFSLITSAGTYQYGSSFVSGSSGSYTINGSWSQTAGSGSYSSFQVYSAVTVPEIDGSVVPKAGFVIAGLFWLLMQRRRQSASLDV